MERKETILITTLPQREQPLKVAADGVAGEHLQYYLRRVRRRRRLWPGS